MKYYIGIDLGGTSIKAGVVNDDWKIIADDNIETDRQRTAEAVIDDMIKLTRSVVSKANLTMEDIEWIGVGTPGVANRATGIVEFSSNFGWHNVPLVKMLEERTNKKIYIENDANAAAYGEYVAGAGKDEKLLIVLTLGTGVGGGIIINNEIYTGFNFGGAELGHTVIVVDGRECSCGRRGCFETYASATGLIRTTREYMEKDRGSCLWKLCGGDISKVNGRTAFDGKRQGDTTAKKIVNTYIKYLACGIINIINTFQPDMLCIGGGISHEGDNLLNPLRQYLEKEVYTRYTTKNTKIIAASLGNDAGIIGAALLGFAKQCD